MVLTLQRACTYDELGRCTYSLLINGEKADTITLGVPGLHNVYNSLAAVAAARKLSVDMEHIKAGLSNFKGTNRRFEKKGTFNGVTVIDDYAEYSTLLSPLTIASFALISSSVISDSSSSSRLLRSSFL